MPQLTLEGQAFLTDVAQSLFTQAKSSQLLIVSYPGDFSQCKVVSERSMNHNSSNFMPQMQRLSQGEFIYTLRNAYENGKSFKLDMVAVPTESFAWIAPLLALPIPVQETQFFLQSLFNSNHMSMLVDHLRKKPQLMIPVLQSHLKEKPNRSTDEYVISKILVASMTAWQKVDKELQPSMHEVLLGTFEHYKKDLANFPEDMQHQLFHEITQRIPPQEWPAFISFLPDYAQDIIHPDSGAELFEQITAHVSQLNINCQKIMATWPAMVLFDNVIQMLGIINEHMVQMNLFNIDNIALQEDADTQSCICYITSCDEMPVSVGKVKKLFYHMFEMWNEKLSCAQGQDLDDQFVKAYVSKLALEIEMENVAQHKAANPRAKI